MIRHRLNFFERLTQTSYSELFLLWISVNAIATIIYFTLASVLPAHAPTGLAGLDLMTRIGDSLYFALVTGTSTGYGDIVPQGFSKVIACAQVILALMIFAVFVSKLVTRRQEMALEEVHRMTAEGIFYNVRHGLFLVRKDFDFLIQIIAERKAFNEQEWEILTTAYLQAQNLIEDILNLYQGVGRGLHVIDQKREKLVLEAIHRTMRRADRLLESLSEAQIHWGGHRESMHELKNFIRCIENVVPVWKQHSTQETTQAFAHIDHLRERLSGHVRQYAQQF